VIDFRRDTVEYSLDIGVEVDNDSVELGIGEYEFITLGMVIRRGDPLVDSVDVTAVTGVIGVEGVDSELKEVDSVEVELAIVEIVGGKFEVDFGNIFGVSFGNLKVGRFGFFRE